MSQKSIVIQRPKPAGAEAWINDAVKSSVPAVANERRKRLTLDVSEDLHRRIKMRGAGRVDGRCAARDSGEGVPRQAKRKVVDTILRRIVKAHLRCVVVARMYGFGNT